MSTPAEIGAAERADADHGEPGTEHPEPAAGHPASATEHPAPAIGRPEPAAGRPVNAAVDSSSGLDDELLERLNLAGRQLSAATVLFHTTLAELRGLSVTEEKAVDLLLRCGPLTHAALGEQTGLAPASVSDLIDRLERKGYARRTPHPQDRRRVLIEGQLDRIEEDLAPLFASWIQDLEELYRRYSRPELELLCDFMTRAAARQRAAAARLAAH